MNSKQRIIRTVGGIGAFYKKILVPTLPIAILFALAGGSVAAFGVAYLFISLNLHFFIYEILYARDYYFYYNLGLSKLNLWLATFGIGVVVGLFSIGLGI